MLKYPDWKKGMKVILTAPMGMAKRGVLLTDSKYIITSHSGLYYADIQWENGRISRNYMICRHSLKPVETRETEEETKNSKIELKERTLKTAVAIVALSGVGTHSTDNRERKK